jgi:hypothetical protein
MVPVFLPEEEFKHYRASIARPNLSLPSFKVASTNCGSIVGIVHLRMRGSRQGLHYLGDSARELWIAERTLRPYQAVHFRKDFVHRGILCGESDQRPPVLKSGVEIGWTISARFGKHKVGDSRGPWRL